MSRPIQNTGRTTGRSHLAQGARKAIGLVFGLAIVLACADPGCAQEEGSVSRWIAGSMENPEAMFKPMMTLAAIAFFSLAPAALLMTTSYIRITVVLGLLRQAIGAQFLPSNQVITALSLFLTSLVMTPVWTQVYHDAVAPYRAGELKSPSVAWQRGVPPVRQFMSQQIEKAENSDTVWMFMRYLPEPISEPETYDDVPLQVLVPAFMLSELKVAFLIGFRIFLPFLIIDLVVASVSTSMGMMMLPPTIVSLPMKLLLFVLVDGWHLVAGMLLESFSYITP